jgi:chromosome partitioning protein
MGGRIVTFVNQKGGVGKTTTAVSLAVALARRGQRVVLVDLDAQANATSALGVEARNQPGVYEALLGETLASDNLVRVEEEGLSLLPSSAALAGAEVELVPMLARERRLEAALTPLKNDFDWVLIDCPPSLGLLTVNALTASESVIIPVQCEYMALEGLSRLMDTLELVRKNLNPSLSVLGVVLTMFDPRTRLSQQVVDEVRRHFSQTFTTLVPRSVRLSEAPSHGESIFRYDPGGRGAAAYEALAAELLERVGVAV